MNVLIRLGAVLFVPVLLLSCSFVPDALTDEEVEQYVRAYKNIALVSSRLEEVKKESGSLTILTCADCLEILDQAVRDAGYKDLKTFFIADVRIHLAMRHLLYLELSKIVGGAATEVPVEDFCGVVQTEGAASTEDAAVRERCAKILMWGRYVKQLGAVVKGVAERLLNEGDIEAVGRYAEHIQAAWTDEALVDEFLHVRGGFDD